MGGWGGIRPDAELTGDDQPARSALQECVSLWIELDHGTVFPEDYNQFEPAAFTLFRIRFANGNCIEDRLDSQGFARFDNIPAGPVTVEYEPTIEEEVEELKKELQDALAAIVDHQLAESAAISDRLNDARTFGLEFRGSNEIARAGIYFGAGVKGLWNGLVGIVSFALDVLAGAGKALWELALRVNPMTAPEKFQQDLEWLMEQNEALQRFAKEDLEAYAILMSDPEVYGILMIFAEDYLAAQHSLEWTESGGEIAFDVILAVVTAGAGSLKQISRLDDVKAILDKLVDALKRRDRRRDSARDDPDTRIVTRVPMHRVACFQPGSQVRQGYLSRNPNRTDADFEAEYDRQLQMQQDGLSSMTAEEYLAGRQIYNGNRDAAVARDARRIHREELVESYYEAAIEEGLGADEARSQATSQADAEMATLAALHNPDLVAGGADQIGGFGDKGVNSSIGSLWSSENRLDELDRVARSMVESGRGSERLNVNLSRCGAR